MEGDQEGDFHGGGGGGGGGTSGGIHSQPESSGSVDMNYLLSKFGILKVLEIVLLLISFASLTGYDTSNDGKFKDRYNFFYFATITNWLLVIIIFLVFLVRLNRRVNVNWNLVMMVYSFLTVFLLLLASALILDAAAFWRKHEEFKGSGWSGYCNLERCGNIEAAGAFGIFCMVTFIIDGIFFFVENRRSSAPPPIGAEQF